MLFSTLPQTTEILQVSKPDTKVYENTFYSVWCLYRFVSHGFAPPAASFTVILQSFQTKYKGLAAKCLDHINSLLQSNLISLLLPGPNNSSSFAIFYIPPDYDNFASFHKKRSGKCLVYSIWWPYRSSSTV